MTEYCIAVLYNRSLFAAGVESRLRSYSELEIVRVDGSRPDALKHLADVQPEVIIMDLDDAGLEAAAILATILVDMPDVQIIALDQTSDQLCLFTQGRCTGKTADNLLQAVSSLLSDDVTRGEPESEHGNGARAGHAT